MNTVEKNKFLMLINAKEWRYKCLHAWLFPIFFVYSFCDYTRLLENTDVDGMKVRYEANM